MSEGTKERLGSGIRAMNKTKGNQSDFVKTGTTPPTLKIDWALYEKYLEDSDLSDAQKKSLSKRFGTSSFRLLNLVLVLIR